MKNYKKMSILLIVISVSGLSLKAGFWDDVKETAEKTKEKADEAKNYYDDHKDEWKEDTKRTIRRTKKKAREAHDYYDDHKDEWKEETKRTIRRTKEKVRETRDYYNEHKDEWKENSERTLRRTKEKMEEIAESPQKQRDLVRKAMDMKQELELTTIRVMPVVDPDSGRLISFDHMMRKQVDEMGIGGSLGEDPVGTAYLMMVDSDYMMDTAKIIPGSSESQFYTLSEALDMAKHGTGNFDESSLTRASESHNKMKSAAEKEDWNEFEQNSEQFTAAVQNMQKSKGIGEQTSMHIQHASLWQSVDSSIILAMSFFEEKYSDLFGMFREMEMSEETAAWLSSIIICAGLLVALILLWRLSRHGLKTKLREAQIKLEYYEANGKGNTDSSDTNSESTTPDDNRMNG